MASLVHHHHGYCEHGSYNPSICYEGTSAGSVGTISCPTQAHRCRISTSYSSISEPYRRKHSWNSGAGKWGISYHPVRCILGPSPLRSIVLTHWCPAARLQNILSFGHPSDRSEHARRSRHVIRNLFCRRRRKQVAIPRHVSRASGTTSRTLSCTQTFSYTSGILSSKTKNNCLHQPRCVTTIDNLEGECAI